MTVWFEKPTKNYVFFSLHVLHALQPPYLYFWWNCAYYNRIFTVNKWNDSNLKCNKNFKPLSNAAGRTNIIGRFNAISSASWSFEAPGIISCCKTYTQLLPCLRAMIGYLLLQQMLLLSLMASYVAQHPIQVFSPFLKTSLKV